MPDTTIVRRLQRLPAATCFMARAIVPKSGDVALPAIALELAPQPTPHAALTEYLRLTGQHAGATLPLHWPQVRSFRLQMALLTERRFPLPIWSALQVRNHVVQHAALPLDASYTHAIYTRGLRRLDKGIEVDLHATVRDERGTLVWESLTTYFWRGRRGGGAVDGASPSAASPTVEGDPIASWNSGSESRLRFGSLTGDYNGLHWSDWYARAFGFTRAFHHPPRIAGQCLAHLPLHADPPLGQLELWFKGPVFYGSRVALRSMSADGIRLFALSVDSDTRPALVGRWRPAAPS